MNQNLNGQQHTHTHSHTNKKTTFANLLEFSKSLDFGHRAVVVKWREGTPFFVGIREMLSVTY